MIDVIMCIRRRGDISPEQFHDYWRNTHGELVNRHAPKLGIRRYVQHHANETGLEAIVQDSRGCAHEGFDGVAVISFDSLEDMAANGAQPESLAASEELLEDERNFIDHQRSLIWFTDHHDVIA